MAVADGMPAAGLVFLGYPLHPPGKPERIRDEHLYRIDVPMIFVEGTRDPFATPELLAGVIAKLGDRATLISIEGGDHSFNVRGAKRDAREVAAALAPEIAAHPSGNGPADAAQEPTQSRVLPSAGGATRPGGRSAVGAGAGLRRPPRRRPEGVPVSGMRPHRARRGLAPGRGARGRRRRPPALAHGVLEARAQAPRPIPGTPTRRCDRPGGLRSLPWRSPRTSRREAPACIPPSESKRLPCDLCGTPMEPEHAHYRCPACHYILPCCGW